MRTDVPDLEGPFRHASALCAVLRLVEEGPFRHASALSAVCLEEEGLRPHSEGPFRHASALCAVLRFEEEEPFRHASALNAVCLEEEGLRPRSEGPFRQASALCAVLRLGEEGPFRHASALSAVLCSTPPLLHSSYTYGRSCPQVADHGSIALAWHFARQPIALRLSRLLHPQLAALCRLLLMQLEL
jgi:hypothetical protein